MMQVHVGMKPTGQFRVETHSAQRGTKTLQPFKNLVLDVGWAHLRDRAFSYGNYPQYLFLGTGTREPARSDTGLESRSPTLAGRYRQNQHTQLAVRYEENVGVIHEVELRFDYDEGEAEGVWTELGLAFDRDYTEPYNRSLFRDEQGAPTSLTILADEYLTVYVRLQIQIDDTPQVGSFAFNGESITYTALPVTYRGEPDSNIFSNGLARDARHGPAAPQPVAYQDASFGGALPTRDSGVSTAIDAEALQVDATVSLAPSSSETTIHVLGFTASGGFRAYEGMQYIAILDTPITKGVDEKLVGGWSIQYSRDEAE